MSSNKQRLREKGLELRAWAEESGYFHSGSSRRSNSVPDGAHAAEMFGAAGARALSAKPITAIGINSRRVIGDSEGVIFVYTARALRRDEQENMKGSFALDTPIEFRTAKPYAVDPGAAAAVNKIKLKNQKYPCGNSISIGNVREAGTLGALVVDEAGNYFGLSANHVSGGCSCARRGTPIVAPGILDVGPGQVSPQVIGEHYSVLPMVPGDPSASEAYKTNRDAALFSLTAPKRLSSFQGVHYDTPSHVTDPIEDSNVEKVGRTTGLTEGYIESEIIGAERIDYSTTVFHSADENQKFSASVFFESIYIVQPQKAGAVFAAGGDSGALVTAIDVEGQRSAVGLLIAGKSTGAVYMLALSPILREFGVSLVDGH